MSKANNVAEHRGNLHKWGIVYVPTAHRVRDCGNTTIHNSLKESLGINLSKNVKYLYNENVKLLKKETTSWKGNPCSQVERSNIMKMTFYQKPFIDSMQSLSKSKRTSHSAQK